MFYPPEFHQQELMRRCSRPDTVTTLLKSKRCYLTAMMHPLTQFTFTNGTAAPSGSLR